MMTLKEFIDQYRISDGRRYCKLEEGLQSRYIRQVYESYIDYVYEHKDKISENDLCVLKKVYGIDNYIKEKEHSIETGEYEKEKLKHLFSTIHNNVFSVIDETRGYIHFKEAYDNLTILEKMEVRRLFETTEKQYWKNLYAKLISEPENNDFLEESSIPDNKKIHEQYVEWYETVQKPLEKKRDKRDEVIAKTYLFVIMPLIIAVVAWFILVPLLKIVGKIWFVGFEAMTNTNVTGGNEIISTHGQSNDFDFILGFFLSIMLIISTIFLFVKKK